MGTDLATYDNSWYRPGSALKRICWYFMNALVFKSSLFPFIRCKVFILRLFGASVGRNIVMKPGVSIRYPWFLEIGDNAWIGENVWIDNLAKVTIGKNACISQGSLLLTGNHDYTNPAFELIVREIVLEDGVWIGAGVIVCSGAICRNHVVVSVGSVVVGELAAMGIYRGNPAVRIKERIFNNK